MAPLDVVVNAFELVPTERLWPDARVCCNRGRRYDLASWYELHGTGSEVNTGLKTSPSRIITVPGATPAGARAQRDGG